MALIERWQRTDEMEKMTPKDGVLGGSTTELHITNADISFYMYSEPRKITYTKGGLFSPSRCK